MTTISNNLWGRGAGGDTGDLWTLRLTEPPANFKMPKVNFYKASNRERIDISIVHRRNKFYSYSFVVGCTTTTIQRTRSHAFPLFAL